MVWLSGSVLVSINECNLLYVGPISNEMHNRLWVGEPSVCNQPTRTTQPGHPFLGRRNEYQRKTKVWVKTGTPHDALAKCPYCTKCFVHVTCDCGSSEDTAMHCVPQLD